MAPSILDIIADVVEGYTGAYRVVIGDLPETGDVLLVSDARGKTVLEELDANGSKVVTMKSLLQLYTRVHNTSFSYSGVYTDLLIICNILQGLCHQTIDAVAIEDISGADIIYLGVDVQGNLIFSCKLSIKYSFKLDY